LRWPALRHRTRAASGIAAMGGDLGRRGPWVLDPIPSGMAVDAPAVHRPSE